jgi:AcrR family transcriptional regulator
MLRRASQAAETRERIVKAAVGLFQQRWYDEVSVQQVADEAGVALSTVVRHFPSKISLLTAAVFHREEGAVCGDDRPGDVEHEVGRLVDQYERRGDSLVRALALEQRVPELRSLLDEGRRQTRAWIERAFAPLLPGGPSEREAAIDDLVVGLDVNAWKVLRRDLGLSQARTVQHFVRAVRGLLRRD